MINSVAISQIVGLLHEPFRRINLLAVAVLLAILCAWHARTTGNLSVVVLLSYALFILNCLIFGGAFEKIVSNLVKNSGGLVFRLLVGFFVFNTLLFVLALASPFGIVINVATLSGFGLVLFVLGRRNPSPQDSMEVAIPSLLCILISGLAATIWCVDSQTPLTIEGQTVIFKNWKDVFFHVRQISVFAQAHGLSTIHDIRLAGVSAPVYHYASYQSASMVSEIADIPAMVIYSSFLLPFGILISGLAAFTLIAFIWGAWPALAAASAILLLPDAYQQGFGNRFLSYAFQAQANQAMLYGIACAALAWVFIIEGTRHGKVLAIAIGYLFVGICLFYKAHIFVANALLVLLYPWIFFKGLAYRWRFSIILILVAIFISVIKYSQRLPGIPIIRLDGSGIGGYVGMVISHFDHGFIKEFFQSALQNSNNSRLKDSLYAFSLIASTTFGVWALIIPAQIISFRKRIPLRLLLLPVCIGINYFLMAMGLALDTRGVGTTEELLNRPLVWAYFFVVSWSAGYFYFHVFGNNLPGRLSSRVAVFVLLVGGLGYTSITAKNLLTFPAVAGLSSYKEFNGVPICVVRSAEYIRNNSNVHSLFQSSKNDRYFIETALTERGIFSGESMFAKPNEKLQQRLDLAEIFKKMTTHAEINQFIRSNNISWYLLYPDSVINWPVTVSSQFVFECDGYKVFNFKW